MSTTSRDAGPDDDGDDHVVDTGPDERAAEGGPTAAAPEETWTDDGSQSVRAPAVIESVPAREQRLHLNTLQSRLLTGLGALFLITLGLVIGATALGWITEDFGTTLAQMVLPALLTFGGTIVGTLFNSK